MARNGELVMFVAVAFSELKLPENLETTVMAEGDHSSLVKFENTHNKAYRSVVDVIRRFMSKGDMYRTFFYNQKNI